MTCLQLALATMYYSKPKTNNSTGTLHTSVCTQYHRNINDFRGRWKTDTCQSFWFKTIICSKGSHQMHSCEMLWVSFIVFPISKSWTFSMKASAVMVYLPHEMHFIDNIFLCKAMPSWSCLAACVASSSTKEHHSVVSHKCCGVTKSGERNILRSCNVEQDSKTQDRFMYKSQQELTRIISYQSFGKIASAWVMEHRHSVVPHSTKCNSSTYRCRFIKEK